MITPKSVKTASLVSMAVITLWIIMTVASYIFQDAFIRPLADVELIENTRKIVPWEIFVQFFCALILAGMNFLLINNKFTRLPLIISAISVAAAPPLWSGLHNYQSVLVAHIEGENQLARLSTLYTITNISEYFLTAAMITTISAAAVYAYAKTRAPENHQTN